MLDKDTFNKEARRDMQEHRLKVIIVSPAAPPSPVPEADESGTEGSSASHSVPAQCTQEALKLQLGRVKREQEELLEELVREETDKH